MDDDYVRIENGNFSFWGYRCGCFFGNLVDITGSFFLLTLRISIGTNRIYKEREQEKECVFSSFTLDFQPIYLEGHKFVRIYIYIAKAMSQNSETQVPKINVSLEENSKGHEQDEQIKPRQTRFKIPTIQNSRDDMYRQQQQRQKDKQPVIIQQQPGCSTLGRPKGGGLARMGGGERQKVRLAPGHSALDWSELNKKVLQDKSRSNELLYGLRTLFEDKDQLTILERINSENMDTVLKLYRFNIPCHLLHPPLRINEQLLRLHQKDEREFWTVIHGNVYCVGSYMEFHPGGSEILVHYGEKFVDVGFWFNKFHRWVNYEKLLQNCYIGKFVKDK